MNNLEKDIKASVTDYLTLCGCKTWQRFLQLEMPGGVKARHGHVKCEELFTLNTKPFDFQSSEIFKLEILPTQEDV